MRNRMRCKTKLTERDVMSKEKRHKKSHFLEDGYSTMKKKRKFVPKASYPMDDSAKKQKWRWEDEIEGDSGLMK